LHFGEKTSFFASYSLGWKFHPRIKFNGIPGSTENADGRLAMARSGAWLGLII
jgi:hypothetical protein